MIVLISDWETKRGRVKASKGTARISQNPAEKRNGIRTG